MGGAFLLRSLLFSAAVPSSCPLVSRTMASVANSAIVKPTKEHKSTVIFLHGRGDQGYGWAESFKSEIRHENTKYICPNSAMIPVTMYGGEKMYAWYDQIVSGGPPESEDGASIQKSVADIHAIIESEVAAGIPASRIVLGGFSMGGALALYSAITYPHALGGIVGLSCRTIQKHKTPANHTANLSTPLLLCHGTADAVIDVEKARETNELWTTFNGNVNYIEYKGLGHTSSRAEMRQLKSFIDDRINS